MPAASGHAPGAPAADHPPPLHPDPARLGRLAAGAPAPTRPHRHNRRPASPPAAAQAPAPAAAPCRRLPLRQWQPARWWTRKRPQPWPWAMWPMQPGWTKPKYPKHASGQACGNCALYQGTAGAPPGPAAVRRQAGQCHRVVQPYVRKPADRSGAPRPFGYNHGLGALAQSVRAMES